MNTKKLSYLFLLSALTLNSNCFAGEDFIDGKGYYEVTGTGTINKTIYGDYTEYGNLNSGEVQIGYTQYDHPTINGSNGLAIVGARSKEGNVDGGKVTVYYGTLNGDVYGGYADNGSVSNSEVHIMCTVRTNYEQTNFYGKNDGAAGSNNKLFLEVTNGRYNDNIIKSIHNFDEIHIPQLTWENGATFVKVKDSIDLSKTDIIIGDIRNTSGDVNVGDSYVVIKGENGLGLNDSEEKIKAFSGVATSMDAVLKKDSDEVKIVIEGKEINSQTDLVAENRAVAAAFINQGTDLIADSLDVLSRDGKYGIKTFAAVHGNRSKYDVNSDLKINGWSSIVGVGNEKNIGNGDFSWGVFYENGSGNYRTYNQFNNEFFRGDGSLVYNGGGIAARFEQDNGVYTEGSLRAGMLKSEMSNALKDGAGNSYGYKSESTYYGAHIGAGKIISLNEATDLDVYGKFFHTYTDGDGFSVADDRFEFDSITSDRLRIGARLTTNKENKFSTYYGLAYEYEFNGDAQMRVKNMNTPEQSLKGSSCMAEIGMNYKPSSESPWSFDLSMRGYAGQRDGFSGNVQATYTF